MKCPKCSSPSVVEGKVNGYKRCYNCGYEDITAKFLENGDVIEAGDINIMRIKDVHPLLNPDSKHYNMFDGLESIEVLEAIMTTTELMAWCRGNTYKYRLRLASKEKDGTIMEGVLSDVKKIQTYESYYKYLKDKKNEADN